jgi:PncC family amidohydrolase
MSPAVEPLADQVVARLAATGRTVGTAESLTGGLLCAALVSVPGASAVVRGGLVAYAEDVKTRVLGVSDDLVRREGTVAGKTAVAMAEAARGLLGADWAVATTGVAGPDQVEGKPVGTVHVAVCGPDGSSTREIRSPGTREQVRTEAVGAALGLLRDALAG